MATGAPGLSSCVLGLTSMSGFLHVQSDSTGGEEQLIFNEQSCRSERVCHLIDQNIQIHQD